MSKIAASSLDEPSRSSRSEYKTRSKGDKASRYSLAQDVFCCVADSRIVFLDLRRDQYFCLNQEHTRALNLRCDSSGGGCAELLMGELSYDSNDSQHIVRGLVGRGLLAQHGPNRGSIATAPIEIPNEALLSEGHGITPTIRFHHWVVFLRASIKASWKLRWYPLHRTVQSVRKRKARGIKSKNADEDALHQLLAIFQQLRPFYGRKYLCLFDSLALVEFLAHYRFYPQWVYGVTAEPFRAHCWVQDHGFVLNDIVERVRGYTPIMAV